MFPARAGMSRASQIIEILNKNVPRASGDEPDAEAATGALGGCSPRERG